MDMLDEKSLCFAHTLQAFCQWRLLPWNVYKYVMLSLAKNNNICSLFPDRLRAVASVVKQRTFFLAHLLFYSQLYSRKVLPVFKSFVLEDKGPLGLGDTFISSNSRLMKTKGERLF